MMEPDLWTVLEEIGRTRHLIVWFAVLELERLTEAGILESSEVGDWRGGYDWRTTERAVSSHYRLGCSDQGV